MWSLFCDEVLPDNWDTLATSDWMSSWNDCIIFVTECHKHILQHVSKFYFPPLFSDELWLNKVTHIQNLTMNSLSTDFGYIWSQTWICVFILNNHATYCFYLHGSYTSTYIANISLVWRRMGLWKYKMHVARCCRTKVRHGMTGVDLAQWRPLWTKKRKIKRIQIHEDLPIMVNMDWDMY
jgi:hypothetical protein